MAVEEDLEVRFKIKKTFIEAEGVALEGKRLKVSALDGWCGDIDITLDGEPINHKGVQKIVLVIEVNQLTKLTIDYVEL